MSDDDANSEDAHHVTQMHQIGGRQNTLSRAVGGLLAGRLGRARSASVVQSSPTSNMVIGVSVEEATTEHAPGDDAPGPQTVVHTLRSQRSTNSLTRKESLMDRARGLTKKLRRKSVLMLSPVTPTSSS
ncbi:hypothetical protein BDZ89DRAFT_1075907 [Hymenopellis radicata]|nr:hypothetical protein BDZ89DRAFT_1075907 [Hymenopellis radicata]